MLGQHLDRNGPVELGVPGEVDRGHPTLAEHALDPVAAPCNRSDGQSSPSPPPSSSSQDVLICSSSSLIRSSSWLSLPLPFASSFSCSSASFSARRASQSIS